MSSSLQARWLQARVLQRLLPEAQASRFIQATQKILNRSFPYPIVRIRYILEDIKMGVYSKVDEGSIGMRYALSGRI